MKKKEIIIPQTPEKDNFLYEMGEVEDIERIPYLSNIPDFVNWIEKEYGESPAFLNKKSVITYSEFVSHIRRRVKWIRELNLQHQSNIGLIAKNDLEAMELFLAIPASGHVLVMVHNTLNHKDLESVSQKFHLKALFAGPEFLKKCSNLPCPVYSTMEISDEEGVFSQVKSQDSAGIFFTGGTTGKPKGAVLSHRALMRGGFNGIFKPGKLIGEKTIAILPLSHIFGAEYCLIASLYKGCFTLICPDMRQAIGAIPIFQPETLALVPGLLDMILNLAKVKGKEFLGSLKSVLCGGAPIPVELQKRCLDFGIQLGIGYGLTEGAAISIGHQVENKEDDFCGSLYPKQEAKIVDGELWLRGSNIMDGYYEDPEATAEVMEDGWLKTGDLFDLDEKGNLVIIGRSKNLIILANGENVSPEEIESLYYSHPMVKECLVKECQLKGNPVVGAEVFPNLSYFSGLSENEISEKIKSLTKEINASLPPSKRVLKLNVRQEAFEKTVSMKIKRK